MNTKTLSFTALLFGIAAIIARQQEAAVAFQLLKPLTTVVIIRIAGLSITRANRTYTQPLVAALVFCLIGDVLLLRESFFLFGLAAFLIAHIVFIYAFSQVNGFNRNSLPLLILAGICIPYFLYLQPFLGSYALPVAVYMGAIILMGWQALGVYFSAHNPAYISFAAGAVLFTLSDALLAFDKFKSPFAGAGILILATYWLAIYSFARSGFYVNDKRVGQP